MNSERQESDKFTLVVRMGASDAHYGGNVVAGARILELFGDAVTGLSAMDRGDEGLLASWEEVKFRKPVYPGDFLQVDACVEKRTKLRSFIKVTANRIVRGLSSADSTVEKVDPPESVADANGVIVIPYAQARGGARNDK
jgi:acyl-CoA hydrolase